MTSRPPDFESLLARFTEDIDLTLAAGPESLSRVLVACRNLRLEPLPEDVEACVRRTFVLPAAEPETGIRVDFIFSTIPYERQAIERAVRVELKGVAVPFAAAEDLILHKGPSPSAFPPRRPRSASIRKGLRTCHLAIWRVLYSQMAVPGDERVEEWFRQPGRAGGDVRRPGVISQTSEPRALATLTSFCLA
jgi:hypothetical protein